MSRSVTTVSHLSARTPPGPSAELTVSAMRSAPLTFLGEMVTQYGDIVRYHADGWTSTLLNHPDYIQHVLQDRWTNYSKEGTPDFMMLRPMLGRGLLTTEGDEWMAQRRLAQPAFHRHKVAELAEVMTHATHATLDEWAARPNPAAPIEADAAMSQLTLRIVARALFGFPLNGTEESFAQAVETLNECTGHLELDDPAFIERYQGALATVHRIVHEIILFRRVTGERPADLLTMLMEARDAESGKPMSVTQLRDQVLTLLLAGHETTAKALAWTLYLLDQHPAIAATLQEEIERVLQGRTPTVEDVPNMPYTWMVLQETMRLRPPIWLISRRTKVDDTIGGYHIPADSLVTLSPYTMHRHPRYWSEPDSFDPTRFEAQAAAGRPAMAFLPFSGGPRLCIGRAFATLEMQLALPMILQRYRLALVENHPVEMEALVTLRARHGLPMIPHPRAAGAA